MIKSSELHVFRGHQPSKTGFIMGHEFTGTVVEVGSAVRTVKEGDSIVSPFTISWYGEARIPFM
jgi:threonine dehydrogenase-like Zn-dependent dehydrogenase